MNEKFLKPYNSKETEDNIYQKWEDSGFFNPDICIEKGATKEDAPTFSMVLPPPNVTGTLHTGHALMLVIQDIMTRYARMQGKRTLWLPGTDHAAIATQSKVEKIIEKEGLKKKEMGREAFLKRVDQFAQESHDTIVNQSKKMGTSLDWSREAFTLDEKRNLAVKTTFKKMYDDGLIYRGYRIVNWDPKGQTVISDDEIVYEERDAFLYTFKYWADFPISISTTRPETKIGDVAVAVHPEDERYQKYIGQTFEGVFCNIPLKIKIVADEMVEKDFGTGALGVTPAHSQVDWEIAQRHNLEVKPIINEFAKITIENEKFNGKKTTEAREMVVEWLKENNLLEKEEKIKQNVSTAERTGAIIEPLPKLQWFIDVNKQIPERENKSLKELMLEAIRKDGIEILPDRFEKIYFHWIENLRDWCISRQIWYGHRVPVWYKDKEIYCGIEAPKEDGWIQDEDTLDTWFSSGMWTFSTLGWPEETKDFKTYHPTTIIETGPDILFFWVARMILMSKYLLNTIPFKTVYLHGMVRDEKGNKMSKSLGNIVNPLDLTAKYGTDALRMAMVVGVGPGNDSNLGEDKIKAYSKFANKIWNITRFVLENVDSKENIAPTDTDSDPIKYLSEFSEIKKEITLDMENYRFHLVSEKIYHYIWHKFADEIIEASKNNPEIKKILLPIWIDCIKMLHPFMPFITEEIWSMLPEKNNLLLVEKWPE
jgi:valyl-tRNA synthetase